MNVKEMFTEIKPLCEDDALTFGKYKGIPLSIVAERDPSYLLWIEETAVMVVMSDSLWKTTTSAVVEKILSQRRKKVDMVSEINRKIASLSDEQKDRKRKRYYAKKSEQSLGKAPNDEA